MFHTLFTTAYPPPVTYSEPRAFTYAFTLAPAPSAPPPAASPAPPAAPPRRPLLKSVVSGGAGGIALVLVAQPFDIVKTLAQNDRRPAAGHVSAVARELVSGGPRALWRGVSAPLIGVTPIFAVCFLAYDAATAQLTAAHNASAAAAGRPRVSARELPLPLVALAGAASAVPTALLMIPGERIKVLAVTAPPGVSTLAAARRAVAAGGARTLYAGGALTLARDASGSSAYFATYEGVSRTLRRSPAPMDGTLAPPPRGALPPPAPLGVAGTLLAGGLAGVAHWCVALPADTLKTRAQAFVPRAGAGAGGGAPRAGALLRALLRDDGVAGLYRGLAPVLLRAFPANAACFAGVEAARRALERAGW